jgi:hypothetical protein
MRTLRGNVFTESLPSNGYTRHNILVGNLNRSRHLRDSGIDGRKILKWVLKKQGARMWNGFIWVRIGVSDRLL